jgi:hypothetical protein
VRSHSGGSSVCRAMSAFAATSAVGSLLCSSSDAPEQRTVTGTPARNSSMLVSVNTRCASIGGTGGIGGPGHGEDLLGSDPELKERLTLAQRTGRDAVGGHIHLPPLALSELQHLELWCANADEALISSLCAEPWPELRSLRLWLAREGQPGLPAAALTPLLDRTRFPKLTSLGLHATSENGPLLERIRASSLGPQLTTLVIDGAVSVGELPEPSGIELLSTGEFFPLRSGRF